MAVQPRSAWGALTSPISTIGAQDFIATKYLWAVIALILHLVDTIMLFNRRELIGIFFIAYFFFAIFAWLLTYGGLATYDGVNRGTLRFDRLLTLFIWGLLAWGLPWIRALFFRVLPTAATLYVDSAIVFFPIMLLCLMLWPGFGTPATSKLGTFYIIVWVILFSINFFATMDTINVGELNVAALEVYAPQLISVTQPVLNVMGGARNAIIRSYDYIIAVPEKFQTAITNQMQYAIDPAAHAVQESKAKRVGVFVSPIKSTGVRLFAGEEVALFTEIQSRLLEEDDEIEINVDCVATLMSTPVKEFQELLQREPVQTFIGQVVPSRTLNLYSLDRQNVDCRWPTQLTMPGNYKVEIFTAFNFSTLGYSEVYFTSRDQLRQYLRDDSQGKQVPVELSTQPTVYTSGPVELGLSMGQGTIGIEESPRVYTLDMWVKNIWQGKVLDVKKIYLMVPKPFRVQSVVGSGIAYDDTGDVKVGESQGCAALQKIFGQEYCDDETTNVFWIDVKEGALTGRRNLRIDLDLSDPYGLIGQEPYTKKFIKAIADYRYEFNPKTSITVHKHPADEEAATVLDPIVGGGAGAR